MGLKRQFDADSSSFPEKKNSRCRIKEEIEHTEEIEEYDEEEDDNSDDSLIRFTVQEPMKLFIFLRRHCGDVSQRLTKSQVKALFRSQEPANGPSTSSARIFLNSAPHRRH